MERDPTCPSEYGGRGPLRRREPRVEDQGRDEGGLRLRQRREPDLLRDPLGDEPCSPVPKARAGRHLLGPVVAGQEDLPVTRLSRQLRDDFEAHVVRPLKVLEREHRRARQRVEDPLDELHHEPTKLDVLGHPGRIAHVEQLPAEACERREPGHRPRQVEERCRRDIAILGCDRPGHRGEATSFRLAPNGGQQAGLADPRLAGEQEELAPAGGDIVEPPIRELEQVITPDEERATNVS